MLLCNKIFSLNYLNIKIDKYIYRINLITLLSKVYFFSRKILLDISKQYGIPKKQSKIVIIKKTVWFPKINLVNKKRPFRNLLIIYN